MQLSPQDRERIKALAAQGWPKARIAELVGCSRQSVYNVLESEGHGDGAAVVPQDELTREQTMALLAEMITDAKLSARDRQAAMKLYGDLEGWGAANGPDLMPFPDDEDEQIKELVCVMECFSEFVQRSVLKALGKRLGAN